MGAFVLALAACIAQLHRAELQTAHAETVQYEDDVSDLFKARGVGALIGLRNIDLLRDLRLQDRTGAWIAGRLPAPKRLFQSLERAWLTYAPNGQVGHIMAYTRPEADGSRHIVGEYLKIRQRQDEMLLASVAAFVGLVASFGLGVGAGVAHTVMRRIDMITQTVDCYAGGRRSLRLPTGPLRAPHAKSLGRASISAWRFLGNTP